MSALGRIAEHDCYPFGVEITLLRQETPNGFDREDPMKFTGHERDFNVGTNYENINYNDYMHARYSFRSGALLIGRSESEC